MKGGEDRCSSEHREGTRPSPRILHVYLAIGALALALRLVYLWDIHAELVFSLLPGDARVYDLWARRIAGGDWIGKGVFYQAPLYPYLMGAVYFAFGPKPLLIKLVQVVLGSAACVLLADAGRRLFGIWAGAAAGLLLAVYPTAIFFDGLIQKTSLELFLLSVFLVILAKVLDGANPAWWGWLGVVLGCLALTRENSAIFMVVVAGWLTVEGLRQGLRWWAWRSGLLLLGALLMLLPVGARNLVAGGEFHFSTSQFGPNLYIGNNPKATGSYVPLRGGHGNAVNEQQDAFELAEKAAGRRLTPREVSRYWANRSFGYILSQPGHWIRLMSVKGAMLLNRVELMDTDDQYTYASYSPTLRSLTMLFNFGVLLPLAAVGLCLAWPLRSAIWVLIALALSYAASVSLFYVVARYRLPLVAFLVIFAGAGLVSAAEALSQGRFRRVGAACLVAVVPAVLSNWPFFNQSVRLSSAMMQNNIGLELIFQEGKIWESLPYFAKAIEQEPAASDAYVNSGVALRMLGLPQKAMDYLRDAEKISPQGAGVHLEMGFCLFDMGMYANAVVEFQKALKYDPSLAQAHYDMGRSLQRLGNANDARQHLAEAARMDPRFSTAQ